MTGGDVRVGPCGFPVLRGRAVLRLALVGGDVGIGPCVFLEIDE